MGLTDAISFNDWQIRSLDPELILKITGQYKPDNGAEFARPPGVTASVTAGSAAPDVQWVHGGSRVVRFSSRIRANTNVVDIRADKASLERLTERDPTLGRAPRISFSWGDDEIVGFATSLRTVVTALWVTGLPREVLFDIEVTEAPDQSGGPGTGETQHLRLASGEIYETLGARYLGNALRGELIRRVNPALAGQPEAAGDRVKVLEREHPKMRGSVLPVAPPFLDGWETVIDELGIDRGNTTRGLPFEALPEVVAGLVVI